ncbi:MAG: hypothetical protein ACRCYU_17900, partial [Nocardioides sp.]
TAEHDPSRPPGDQASRHAGTARQQHAGNLSREDLDDTSRPPADTTPTGSGPGVGLDVVTDSLVYHSRPRLTDPRRVIGAKPAAYARWVFTLLDARPGDHLDDLYPGSGGITRAWASYTAGYSTPREMTMNGDRT